MELLGSSASQSKLREARMLVGAPTQRPMVFPVTLLHREVIDAGDTPTHESALIEFPVFVSIRAKPVAGVIMPFVGKAHRNTVAVKGPQLLDEPIVEFLIPLASEELDNRFPTGKELRPIAPLAVRRVCQRNPLWIPGIPGILSHANLLCCRFCIERWKWWPWLFVFTHLNPLKLIWRFFPQPNARGEPRQQPQRGTSEGCWRRLQCEVRRGVFMAGS